MKISLFLSTARCADVFVPASGTDPVCLTFAEAVEYCKTHHKGHLVNPKERTTQEMLDATHGLHVWIGLYRSSAQNKFFPISKVASFEELVFEAQPKYDWSSNEPNNLGGYQYCGQIYGSGKLDDDDCYMNKPFLCEGTSAREDTPGSRSGGEYGIVDAENAAIIREHQEFENQQRRFNDFLDEAIKEANDMSKKYAVRLRRLRTTTLSKIEFSDRKLCGESLYVEDKYQNVFYYWHLTRNISDHENVCEIYRDVHDGIVHFIHEFGCTGNIRAINRKFTKLLPFFCSDLVVRQKPFGIDF